MPRDGHRDGGELWDEEWSTSRETMRGYFHMGISFLAWIFLHVLSFQRKTIWTILVLVAGPILLLDVLRLQISLALRNKHEGRLTPWRERRLKWLEVLSKGFQNILSFIWARFGKTYKRTSLEDWFTPKHEFALKHWLRGEKERYRLSTAFHFVAGMVVVYIFFPLHVVVFVVFFQGVEDPVAKWIGIRTKFVEFTRPSVIAGKTLSGTGAGFGACIVISFLILTVDICFVPLFPESVSLPCRFLAAWVGCFTAPIAELFGGKWDNFVIPTVSAVVMQSFLYYIC